jgi:CBS domain-containing protein
MASRPGRHSVVTMSSHHLTPPRGSDRAPALEHAVVEDVMRRGIISCGPETDLITVARAMASNHVHAVVVSGTEPNASGAEHLTWGLITALDLVAAALPAVGSPDAGGLANTEILTVDAGEPLARAAQLMVEHELSHLLVVEDALPVGIVSTLDVAGCLAWGEA